MCGSCADLPASMLQRTDFADDDETGDLVLVDLVPVNEEEDDW